MTRRARSFFPDVRDPGAADINRATVGLDGPFVEWLRASRIPQVRVIAALTAALYLIYAVIGLFTLNVELRHVVAPALLIPLLLLLIIVLSIRREWQRSMWWLLALAPIGANVLHHWLKDFDPGYLIFAPEIYLSIIWTFVISGLPLRDAFVSALAIVLLALLGTSSSFHDAGLLWLHLLWILAAFSFGAVGAFVFEHAQRHIYDQQRALLNAARVDDLTGAWNRAHILRLFDEQCARSERYGEPFSVLLIDLDHFKDVNDRHGHVVGDDVLRGFVERIRDRLRVTDAIGRVGGEEFLVLLPQTRLKQAKRVAESLLERIRAEPFAAAGRCTASVGLAEHRAGDDRLTLYNRADLALYAAKRQGRDCIAHQ